MTSIPSSDKPFGRWLSAETRARSIATALANLDLGRTRRWRGRIPIPRKGHPLVKRLFQIMNEQCSTIDEVSARAGVRRKTFSDWRYRCTAPNLFLLIAAYNAMGYDLRPVKIYKDRGHSKGGEPLA